MFLKSAVISTALLVAASLPASAMTEATFQHAAAVAFAKPIKTYEIPGLVVAATIDGKHYVYSHGVASTKTEAPIPQ